MNKKRILFLICVVLAVIGVCRFAEHPLRPVNTDTTVKSVKAFREFPDDSLDLLVFGSSHAWCGIDTGRLKEEYGIEGYNYGCAWQHVNTSKLFLEDALQHQNPKVVVLDTDMLTGVLADTEMCGEIYYSRSVGSPKAKWEYLTQCFGTQPVRYIGYMLPAIVFHENWKELDEYSFMENSNEDDFVQTRGYLGSDSAEPVNIMSNEAFSQEPVPEHVFSVLEEMVQMCEERGIEILLCTIPFEGEFKYGDYILDYAKEKGLYYINYFAEEHDIGLDSETDYRNWEHVNNLGAEKITDNLGELLNKEYGLGVN